MVANQGDILATTISFAVGQAVQAAQNRDVRPRREQDYGTNQHRPLLSMCPNTTRRSRVAKTSSLQNKRTQRSMQICRGSNRCTETFSLKRTNNRQRAKEYKLVATLVDFETPSLKYDGKGRGRN